ncbi:MAG: hypothetical protein LRY51_00210 [Geovibrio sp.]|nr:hypothetical protein [Geovibrio sp.]
MGDGFVSAVELIFSCRGRVVVTGMGKSGHIGKKNCRHLRQHGHSGSLPPSGGRVHGDLGNACEGGML